MWLEWHSFLKPYAWLLIYTQKLHTLLHCASSCSVRSTATREAGSTNSKVRRLQLEEELEETMRESWVTNRHKQDKVYIPFCVRDKVFRSDRCTFLRLNMYSHNKTCHKGNSERSLVTKRYLTWEPNRRRLFPRLHLCCLNPVVLESTLETTKGIYDMNDWVRKHCNAHRLNGLYDVVYSSVPFFTRLRILESSFINKHNCEALFVNSCDVHCLLSFHGQIMLFSVWDFLGLIWRPVYTRQLITRK